MNFNIMLGDNRETLKTLDDNSIDAIVTDPPYGIDFLGKDWDANTGALETYTECLRVLKPGGYILAFSAARTYHHLAVTLEQAGFEIRDQLMWLYASGFPKAQDIGKAIQKRQGVEEYKEIDLDAVTECAGRTGSGGGINRMMNRLDDKGDAKDGVIKQVVPTSPEAKQWEGWKTALKPAHEPICMARKPFKGSTIDNVLEHGVGALNIDATRVGDEVLSYDSNIEKGMYNGAGYKYGNNADATANNIPTETQGRFPSNVLGEVEGYQKYFYCPKISRKERHIGYDLTTIPTNPEGLWDEGVQYQERKQNHGAVGNNHPTVKPVELMKYLIKLVTPPNSTVLDPFNGSGSTGIAAVELGHTYIGCELDPAYVEIAKRRITAWNTPEESGTTFETLFEEK